MQKEYIPQINKLLHECDDIELLEIILQLLHKASLQKR